MNIAWLFHRIIAINIVNLLQRDMTGIVGSWSEFMDYVRASIKSDDVKLILEGHPGREGNFF